MAQMRIIAGEAKGRRLAAPRAGTRPFTGRAKEAVFSSLQPFVSGSLVLDLFAGSGSLGLEALSRGAESVVFVESNRGAIAVLADNVASVGLGGAVVNADVERFLQQDDRTYTLVFVDPPYAFDAERVERILALLEDRLSKDGRVIVHRRAGGRAPESDNLQCTGRRRYGDSEIWILEKEQP
jgi:16S rRNA (guanine966-N2)-methyltransferase